MIAQIDASDDDKDENGRLGITIAKQKRKWDADDDNSLALFKVNQHDIKHIEVTRDLTEDDVGPYIITVNVTDFGDPQRFVLGYINLYINSVAKPLNQTEASIAFEKRPDFLERIAITSGRYFRLTEKFIIDRGLPGQMTMALIITACVLLLLIVILFCWCCYRIGGCCCCKGASGEQDETEDVKLNGRRGTSGYKQGGPSDAYSGLRSDYNKQIQNGNYGNVQYDPKILDYDTQPALTMNL